MSGAKLSLVCFFVCLLCTASSVDWQGYGNMSASNLTTIWSFINGNFGNAVSTSKYDEFSLNFSNHLNSLWDIAWNIVTVSTVAQKDTILYGYAFNDHWMWYNGYKVGNRYFAFVIWKDYNCHTWQTVGENGSATTFTPDQMTTILTSGLPNNNLGTVTDIWGAAKKFYKLLKTKAGFSGSDKEYSIVLSQGGFQDTMFYGRACIVRNYQYYNLMDTMSGAWGKFLVLQTR